MIHHSSTLKLAICAAVLQASLAQAANEDEVSKIAEQLKVLQDTVAAQQRLLQEQAAQIEQLRQQLQAGTSASAGSPAPQAASTGADVARVSMTGARPTITSADGRFSFAPRTVVQFDAGRYQQDSERALTEDFRRGSVGANGNRETNAARDLSDGAFFRRARFGFEGMIARDFNYRVSLELGGSGTEGPTRINDAWMTYSGFNPLILQIGAFSPPANMDDSTPVDSSLFLERAASAEISRTLGGADGRLGLGIRTSGLRWMGALTLTTRTVNDPEVLDSQLALVGRTGVLVASAEDYKVHAGVSGTWVIRPPDQGSSASGAGDAVRFRDRPEIRVDGTRLIDTGAIDADHAFAVGVELGATWKNWYLQGENFWFGIDRPAGVPLADPRFGGYYLQGSWVITGESRRYDPALGAFQSPRPRHPFSSSGGNGAWELALRYSNMDLDFHAGSFGTEALADAVRGGEQNIWTLGVNWYPNANLRFLFNYLRIDVDRLNPAGIDNLMPFGPAPATPPLGAEIGQSLDVYAIRSQFSF